MSSIFTYISTKMGFSQPVKTVVTPINHFQLLRLKTEVPQLDAILTTLGGDLLFGGSRTVGFYTSRYFSVDDTDVFTVVDPAEDHNPDTTKLEKTIGKVCQIHNLQPSQLTVKFARNHPAKSIVNRDDGEIEDFDDAILGTINYQDPQTGKVQYVIVNPSKKGETLTSWYQRCSDLPVYLNVNQQTRDLEFVYQGTDHDRQNFFNGIFSGVKKPRHQNRVEKYEAKGFTFQN